MNDEKLDQMLNEAIRVERAPDLWMRVAPRASTGLSWPEVRWACAVAVAVLAAWALMPREAASLDREWEPVALKARLRAETMTAVVDQ